MKTTDFPTQLIFLLLFPTVILLAGCSPQTLEIDQSPTSTEVESESMELAAASSEDVDSQELDPQVQSCLAEHGNHPEAKRVAKEFDQPVEVVAQLFCNRMGFGEIRHALAIHAETEVELSDLAERFHSGQEWGAIREELNASPLTGDPTGND